MGTGKTPGHPPSISVWGCTSAGLEQGSKAHDQINMINEIINMPTKLCHVDGRWLYKDSQGVRKGGSEQSLGSSEGQISLLLFLTGQQLNLKSKNIPREITYHWRKNQSEEIYYRYLNITRDWVRSGRNIPTGM